MEQNTKLGKKLFRLAKDPSDESSKFVDIYEEKVHIHTPMHTGIKSFINKSFNDYLLPISGLRTIAFTPTDDTFLFFSSGEMVGIRYFEFDNNLHKVLNHITTAPGQLAVVNKETIEYYPEFSFSQVLRGEMLSSNMITVSKKRKNRYEIYVGNKIIGDITRDSFDGEKSPEEIDFNGYRIENKSVNRSEGKVDEKVFCILNRQNYAIAHGRIHQLMSEDEMSTAISIADYEISLQRDSNSFRTVSEDGIDLTITLPVDKDEIQIMVKGIDMTTNLAELLAYMSVSILEPEVFLNDLK